LDSQEEEHVDWRVRAIRGATTVPENTIAAINSAVNELLDAIEACNHLNPDMIISVTFSVTHDLDAVFPAAIARQRPQWDTVAMLDVQHMHVEGSLSRCIRLMIHAQLPQPQPKINHVYLREAEKLRPDWSFSPISLP